MNFLPIELDENENLLTLDNGYDILCFNIQTLLAYKIKTRKTNTGTKISLIFICTVNQYKFNYFTDNNTLLKTVKDNLIYVMKFRNKLIKELNK